MDISQYKELFVSEGREILSSLNTSLVLLEKNPEDTGCLNEIFRQAHTLKGMSASMGYEEITKLTHEMESVLDLLRRGRLRADKETVNLLFESFDALEALVNDIATTEGTEKITEARKKKEKDVSILTSRLQKIMPDCPIKKEDIKEEKRSNLRLEDADRLEVVKAAKEGSVTYRVAISLKKDCAMKEARAFIVVKMLEEMGRVVRSQFLYKQLEGGKFGRHFGLFFTTQESVDLLKEKVEAIQDVDKITFKPLEIDEVMLTINDQRSTINNSSKEAPKRETQMVRVSLDRLDSLMNITGELVINKIRLANIGQSLENKPLSEALTQMGRLSDELQIGIMETRLVPMDYIFNRFPRMARDLAAQEKKEVDLIIEGADIGLDRTILDDMNDPLIHLLRNAVSHGIETPDARKKLGKKTIGLIKLTAKRERNFVIIEVSDDGQGMDPEEIKKIAIKKGIVPEQEAEKLSQEEIFMLITTAGFSTSKSVTQTSGRGVGMNLVKTKVESYGGALNIESKLNAGSKFTLKLPLSMAIIQALLVGVETETYAIPLVNITETIKIETATIKTMEHHEVVPYRDEVLPLIRLREKFGFADETASLRGEAEAIPNKEIASSPEPALSGANVAPRNDKSVDRIPVVVVEIGYKKAGLVVDKLLGQQEVVIKTVKGELRNVPGIAGATILGDGKVAMIVDVASIV